MTQWAEAAARLGARADLPALDAQAIDWIGRLPADQPVLVACSGGADSVFLVMALLARVPHAAARLRLAHFNHRTRGPAGDADADFVRAMAVALDLPFSEGCPREPLPPVEAQLRAARYAWLLQVYHESGAGALCLGQHADDCLESQLMALFSGSGPAGLASPAAVKVFADGHVRLRPLIGLRRERIEQLLRAAGIPWREDASNRDTRHTRNWIRLELAPLLHAHFPQDPHAGSARTRLLMAEAAEALDAAVRALQVNFSNPDRLDCRPLAGQPRAVVRRAIMAWWLRHFPDRQLPGAPLDGLVAALAAQVGAGAWSVGNGLALRLDDAGQLTCGAEAPASPPARAAGASWHWAAGPVFLPDGARLRARRVEWAADAVPPCTAADPRTTAWLAQPPAVLRVRQWLPGDRYRPLGAPGRRKLQDLFTDARVDPADRHRLPVIADAENAILWVPGFAPAESQRVAHGRISALKLTYHVH